LPEQRAWRRFAHLSHRERTPDVRMLHEFRSHIGVSGLRAINDWLVRKLLRYLRADQKTVAVIDATDLPAATADKKRRPKMVSEESGLRGTYAQVRAHALLCRLQEAFIASLAQ